MHLLVCICDGETERMNMGWILSNYVHCVAFPLEKVHQRHWFCHVTIQSSQTLSIGHASIKTEYQISSATTMFAFILKLPAIANFMPSFSGLVHGGFTYTVFNSITKHFWVVCLCICRLTLMRLASEAALNSLWLGSVCQRNFVLLSDDTEIPLGATNHIFKS